MRTYVAEAKYKVQRGTHFASINYADVVERLELIGVNESWPLQVTVEYSVRGGAVAPIKR